MGVGTKKPSKRKRRSDRPGKPYASYPLCPHNSGKWQKKINGRVYYFGRWARQVDGVLKRLPDDGWEDALALYNAQSKDLHAGREPLPYRIVNNDDLELRDLCNEFLKSKQRKLNAGEITISTYDGHRLTTDLLIRFFGRKQKINDLNAHDFAELRAVMAKRWGPVRLSNEITHVKSVFKYGYECGIIEKAMRYGPEFVKPSAAIIRKQRAKNGEQMLEADELRKLIDVAPVPLKSMLLLGLNCGFIGKDCADLPLSALDLDGGWVTFPRPKTGIARRSHGAINQAKTGIPFRCGGVTAGEADWTRSI